MTPAAAQDERRGFRTISNAQNELHTVQKRRCDALNETSEVPSMDELIQMLVEIDGEEDGQARRLEVLAYGQEASTTEEFSYDFSALEGRGALGELEPPLLSPQEILTIGTLSDFLLFARVIEDREASRRGQSEAHRSGSVAPLSDLSSDDSQWSDHDTDFRLCGAIKQEPEERQGLETMLSDAAAVTFPRMDALKVFVRIKDESMPMKRANFSNQSTQPPPWAWSSSFLVGPRHVATASTNASRESPGPCWKDSRKPRSRATISDSRLSEIRRARAAGRPRKSGRFMSSRTQFVSVTTLQTDQTPKSAPTDGKRSVFTASGPSPVIKTEQDHEFEFGKMHETPLVSCPKKQKIESQKEELASWSSASLIDDIQTTSDLEKLIKILSKIDCDEVSDAMRLKALDSGKDSAVSGQMSEHYFFRLDDKSEMDRPLSPKQEKLEPDSIFDLMQCTSHIKKYDESSIYPGVENPDEKGCFSDLVLTEKIETSVQVTSASDWSDSESLQYGKVKQEQSQQQWMDSPSVEMPAKTKISVDSSHLLRPQIDARIFAPKSQVLIEGRSEAMTNFDLLKTSSFLAGPLPHMASAIINPPESSRETRVQRWKDKREVRSRAKPSDSRISQIRRVGAEGRPRRNGRFTSTRTQMVSITALQQ